MIGEISHFLSLSAVVIFCLILIFNSFFFLGKIHPNQLSLSLRMFNQACWLIFFSFGIYVYLSINDDFSIAYISSSWDLLMLFSFLRFYELQTPDYSFSISTKALAKPVFPPFFTRPFIDTISLTISPIVCWSNSIMI